MGSKCWVNPLRKIHFDLCCYSTEWKCISRMPQRSLVLLLTMLNLSLHEQRPLVSRAAYLLPQMNKCKGWRRMLEQQLHEVVLRSHSWPLSLSLATIARFESGNPRNLLRKPELAILWEQFWDQLFKGLINFWKNHLLTDPYWAFETSGFGPPQSGMCSRGYVVAEAIAT